MIILPHKVSLAQQQSCMDVLGVPPFLLRTVTVIANAGLSVVRYRNEEECRCRNQSVIGIGRPSPVPECSSTRCRMPAASDLMPMPSYGKNANNTVNGPSLAWQKDR
jgi:hypothetical protein